MIANPNKSFSIGLVLCALIPLAIAVGFLVAKPKTNRKVIRYIVCPDGDDRCTPYQPHEVKPMYAD